jgi:hypothetical protein
MRNRICIIILSIYKDTYQGTDVLGLSTNCQLSTAKLTKTSVHENCKLRRNIYVEMLCMYE